jgi:hypothetical protein
MRLDPGEIAYLQSLNCEVEQLKQRLTRPAPAPADDDSEWLTAKKAARFLDISDSTFRKEARWIRCTHPQGRYHRDDLRAYARGERLKVPRPPRKGTGRKPK